MKPYGRNSSLHPYLEHDGPHSYLKLSLKTEDPAELEKTPFPFYVVSESDPLIRCHEGHFVTDAESPVQRVFLLAQRDQYLLRKDEFYPTNNPDIDGYWQRAFAFHRDLREKSPLIFLGNQVSGEGRLAPFQPLFFCKARKSYFSPPCPSCASPLEQCRDDALLAENGLQPYSSSLKRYLYCPSCSLREDLRFYVNALEGSDPPGLRDSSALIQEFAKLAEREEPAGSIPCAGCERVRECYGPERLALARMVPFSFYPFYALVFRAPSLHASDFLALLSGATFEELEASLRSKGEPGRIRCLREMNAQRREQAPALFEEDDRRFLEVLYLKLSFLAELIHDFLPGTERPRHPDLRPSLDRFWVGLEEPSGLLPVFWNFRVRPIDLLWNPEGGPPSPAVSETLYFLGLSWFYALLVNSRQNMRGVLLSLEETGSRFSAARNTPQGTGRKESPNDTFLPENIFWNPGEKGVNPAWNSLWERSLQLGWQLWQAARQEPAGNLEGFWKDLDALRRDTRRALFAAGPVEAPSEGQAREQEAIAGILLHILAKWRKRAQAEKEPSGKVRAIPAEKETPDEKVPETVILAGRAVREPPIPPALPKRVDEMAETVIQTPVPPGRSPLQPPGPGSRKPGQATGQKPGPLPDKAPPQGDFMQETVILTPEKLKELAKKK